MAQNEAASLRNTAPIYRKRAARERRIFANGLEAARLKVKKSVEIEHLPAYSPELNPVERR
jgi:transposase